MTIILMINFEEVDNNYLLLSVLMVLLSENKDTWIIYWINIRQHGSTANKASYRLNVDAYAAECVYWLNSNLESH